MTQEITYNATGWNAHIHLVLAFSTEHTTAGARRLQDAVTQRWCSARAAWVGHQALERRPTNSWMRPSFAAADMAEYVTKQSLLYHAPKAARGRYPPTSSSEQQPVTSRIWISTASIWIR